MSLPAILIDVSIHAPPNRKERRKTLSMTSEVVMFQSTPLPTGRSDGLRFVGAVSEAQFQSTPLPTGRSDHRSPASTMPVKVFQSTPLPTGRSDKFPDVDLSCEGGFNPRPSQPEGATFYLLIFFA